MSQMVAQGWSLALMGLLIGAGVALAGYFASQTLLLSRTAVNTASVKGLSERLVEADQFQMSLRYTANVDSLEPIDRDALYARAEGRRERLQAALQELGLTPAEMRLRPTRYFNNETRNRDQILLSRLHTMSGSIDITSDQVALTEDIYARISELSALEFGYSVSSPSYSFSSLNEIRSLSRLVINESIWDRLESGGAIFANKTSKTLSI